MNLTDDIEFVLNTSIFERDTAYTYDYASVMLNIIIMQPMHITFAIYMNITVIDYIQPGSSHTNQRWWEADLEKKR